MPDRITSLFLAQFYQDAWADYQRALTRVRFAQWDYVILTASNEHQAEGFRAQLEQRRREGFLPERVHFAVLPDPEGKRVGSGGATLGALRYIAEHSGRAGFAGLRVLVIHSGGDSKRAPQYSSMGKLFSPVPRELPNGRASTLFDETMMMMAGVPARMREGMLLLAGDVLLLFNPLQIDDSGEGAAAISFKEDVETGKNHGVFLRGADGHVARFLHKQSVETLRACGAVNEHGKVDIDTGAVIFSARIMSALYGLICEDGRPSDAAYRRFVSETVRLSLYGDFLYPLSAMSTLEAFYREAPEGGFSDALIEARTAVWNALRPFRMKLMRLAPARFIHFGTTQEVARLMNGGVDAYRDLGWSRCVNSSIGRAEVSGYNSVLSEGARCGGNTYLEASYVHKGAVIGESTLLSYVDIHDETIPDRVVLHGLKQMDGGFVVRIYGVEDNPKDTLEGGALFLGQPLGHFLEQNGIAPEELWPEGGRSVWEAALYPVCRTIGEAVAAALNVYALAQGRGDVQAWRGACRKSLKSGFHDADPHALLAWDLRMRQLMSMERLAGLIRSGEPATRAAAVLRAQSLTPIQQKWLEERLKTASYSEQMRLMYYIGSALGGAEGEKYLDGCFRCIERAVVQGAPEGLAFDENCRITAPAHTVRMPLRVNWGGGWSDTPPYCLENGGTVLNAAIELDGRMPVEVTLTRLNEPKIVFDSRDMDTHGEFAEIQPLQASGNPYDPFALQKAALLSCGVIPAKGGELGPILDRRGGGFRMQTEVTGVPKGSGLGTSSILAAACVKALSEFMGIARTEAAIYERVLCMEQIMSTGGGWQDQVGGLTGGVKYITSAPGLNQNIRVEHLCIPEAAMAELQERFCLIYTGQRRLARNLLRDVVGRYIGSEPDSVRALNEIQRVAALMRFELERGHIDDFAALLTRHWALSRQVDAGSSNILIDQIFQAADELIDGRMICGAGGGGFLQVILKKGVTHRQLHDCLKGVFQDSDVDVWECRLVF